MTMHLERVPGNIGHLSIQLNLFQLQQQSSDSSLSLYHLQPSARNPSCINHLTPTTIAWLITDSTRSFQLSSRSLLTSAATAGSDLLPCKCCSCDDSNRVQLNVRELAQHRLVAKKILTDECAAAVADQHVGLFYSSAVACQRTESTTCAIISNDESVSFGINSAQWRTYTLHVRC